MVTRLLLVLSLLAAACTSPRLPPTPPDAPAVVLLHGLGRTHRSMRSMARHLAGDGFRVVNIGYPSRARPADELALLLDRELRANALGSEAVVHFVAHSAGGILARHYLSAHPDFPVGRVVLLGPPNAGSELARRLSFLGFWTGPFAAQLASGPACLPASLPAPHFDLGVIAGDSSVIPPFSWMIDGPDDGFVAVAETRIPGARDHLVVHRAHGWIMDSREVQRQAAHFLRHGAFAR